MTWESPRNGVCVCGGGGGGALTRTAGCRRQLRRQRRHWWQRSVRTPAVGRICAAGHESCRSVCRDRAVLKKKKKKNSKKTGQDGQRTLMQTAMVHCLGLQQTGNVEHSGKAAGRCELGEEGLDGVFESEVEGLSRLHCRS